MKKTLYILAAVLLVNAPLFAQTDRYTATMEKFLGMMEEAETVAEMQQLANTFERVSMAETEQWLPAYYAAYSNIMLAFMPDENKDIDALLDKAESQIEKAESIGGEHAELYVLHSMVASARMQIDPQSRAMVYGPKIGMMASKALELEENNPRAWMQQGQSTLYTPAQWGGGVEKGCKMLRTAKQHYGSYEPETAFHPDWGEEYLDEVIKQGCSGDGHNHDHDHQDHEDHDHSDHDGHDH